MITSPFDRFTSKLEQDVYGSLRGALRLQLILDDIVDYCPAFTEKSLSILDVGGGNGYFDKICLEKDHRVLLVDASKDMLEKAEDELTTWMENRQLELAQMDFVVQDFSFDDAFDLVLMHGSADWMSDPECAIHKTCACLKPGGILSLLIYNKDKSILKRGINGHLVGKAPQSIKKKLIAPGAKTPAEIQALLEEKEGELLLQSGIRIFLGFFRQIDRNTLTPQQWLEQERIYYRTPPFSPLGEHTHLIWQASLL